VRWEGSCEGKVRWEGSCEGQGGGRGHARAKLTRQTLLFSGNCQLLAGLPLFHCLPDCGHPIADCGLNFQLLSTDTVSLSHTFAISPTRLVLPHTRTATPVPPHPVPLRGELAGAGDSSLPTMCGAHSGDGSGLCRSSSRFYRA
jgi:hypothetical protein